MRQLTGTDDVVMFNVDMLNLLDGRFFYDDKELQFTVSDLWDAVLGGGGLEYFLTEKAPE